MRFIDAHVTRQDADEVGIECPVLLRGEEDGSALGEATAAAKGPTGPIVAAMSTVDETEQ
jgi:hypothetical protein